MVDERDDGEKKEDLFDKEEKFDAFTPEGEALGYISLEQARLVAMQTARDDPGNYGSRFSGVRMVYEVVEQDEGEDYYTITMTFRPEGDFRGTPGREQFVIEKEGRVAYRQVIEPTWRRAQIPDPSSGHRACRRGGRRRRSGRVVRVRWWRWRRRGCPAARAPTAAPAAPAAAPVPTDTATPPPTASRVPTPRPPPTATGVPAARPAPTFPAIAAAPPVTFLSQENLRYALRDLPPNFQEQNPTELGVSMAAFGEFFSQIVAFASTEPDPLQFVFAASGEVTGLQRAQSEAEMADSGAYLEGIVGEFVGTGQDVELVESGLLGVPPVGEEALGIFIVFQSQGVVLRLDVVQFIRGDLVGLVFTMYSPQDIPPVAVRQAALMLDAELLRFPAAVAIAPTPTRTPTPTRIPTPITPPTPTRTPTPTPATVATLIAFPTIVQPGQEIVVSWSGGPGTDGDWIAMYEIGAANEDYGSWDYISGLGEGSMTFFAPSTPGPYEFRLLPNDEFEDIARSSIILVEGEPSEAVHGDSIAEATFLEPGVTLGAIDPADDLDYFVFVALPGFIYTIEVQLAGHPDTVATLFDPSGFFILENDDAEGLSQGSRVHWASETGGDYYVEVKSLNQDSDTGRYAVVLSAIGPGEDDHGYSFDTATFIGPGVMPGLIVNPADKDFFAFTAQGGTEYTIEARLGTHQDTVLELYDSAGNYLDESDDADGLNGGSRLFLTPSFTGEYFLVVRSYDEQSSGSYVLAVIPTAGPTPTPILTPTRTATPIPVPPNLVPFKAEGWEAPLVVTEGPSSFVDLAPPGGGPFGAGKEVFVHWAVKNVSTSALEQQFHVAISVDG